MKLRDILLTVLGVLALVWYFYCLIYLGTTKAAPVDPNRSAAVASPSDSGGAPETPMSFRSFASFSLTTIGASLATFVGMLLGLKQAGEAMAATGNKAASGAVSTSPLQWIAAALYVVSLLVALWFWKQQGAPDPAVLGLAKSTLGLLGGALAVVLNKQP